MRNDKGFTMIEMLIALTLLGIAIALTVSAVNYSGRAASNTGASIMANFGEIESAAQTYFQDKSTWPTGLDDTSFVPKYLFPPKAPNGYDLTHGVDGYLFDKQTGQASPNNGYYVCSKVTVASATDVQFEAIKYLKGQLSAHKFFYNTACPATSNAADPAGSTTLYPTYWITRE